MCSEAGCKLVKELQGCSFQLSRVVIHDGVSFLASILHLLICVSLCGVTYTVHVSLHTCHKTNVEITEQVALPSCYHIVFGDGTWVIRLDSKDHYLPSQLSNPCVSISKLQLSLKQPPFGV